MQDLLISTLGGVGLFLVGMSMLTNALRNLAGRRFRKLLVSWTTTTASGVATGALSTAILQSSSATTIAAVGFVGAGLLTFEQSLGIIFGANLGTTITGWLVAVFGFKLDIGAVALPIVFVGAVLRLFGADKTKALGHALAGFGLLFVGIEMLQAGLGGLEHSLLPREREEHGLLGVLGLVAIGAVVTLITQSSSAGVAAALAGVHSGFLDVTDAAAMVIGMDIGTTFTAYLATLGGTVMATRTGYAHVVYNIFTAAVALTLLTPFFAVWDVLSIGTPLASPELALVAFHTFFNFAGVLAVLPVVKPFANLLRKIVPECRLSRYSKLDEGVLDEPELAWPQVERYLVGHVRTVTKACESAARSRVAIAPEKVTEFLSSTEQLRELALRVGHGTPQGLHKQAQVRAMYVLDHLDRLLDRHDDPERLEFGVLDAQTNTAYEDVMVNLRALSGIERVGDLTRLMPTFENSWRRLEEDHQQLRANIMWCAARGELTLEAVTSQLDALRLLRRNAYHLWRIAFYLAPTEGVVVGSSPTPLDTLSRR